MITGLITNILRGIQGSRAQKEGLDHQDQRWRKLWLGSNQQGMTQHLLVLMATHYVRASLSIMCK